MTSPFADERARRDTPLVHLRSVFARFLQELFSEAPVGHYRWSPDRETTEIVIQGQNVLDATTASQRPGITIGRGPVQMRRLGLGDVKDFSFETGKTTKSALLPSVVYVNCCSRNDLESEHIAWIAMEHIWLLGHLIETAGMFDTGRDLYIAQPVKASSLVSGNQGEEWYCTAVQVPVLFPRTSSVSPTGLRLAQRLEARMSSEAAHAAGEEGTSADGVNTAHRGGVEGAQPFGSIAAGELPTGRATVPKRYPRYPGDPFGA